MKKKIIFVIVSLIILGFWPHSVLISPPIQVECISTLTNRPVSGIVVSRSSNNYYLSQIGCVDRQKTSDKGMANFPEIRWNYTWLSHFLPFLESIINIHYSSGRSVRIYLAYGQKDYEFHNIKNELLHVVLNVSPQKVFSEMEYAPSPFHE